MIRILFLFILIQLINGQTGACCNSSTKICSIQTLLTCTSIGGIYQGDNTTCPISNMCGACCPTASSNQCLFTTSLLCSSNYQGDNTSCPSSGLCGACCYGSSCANVQYIFQ